MKTTLQIKGMTCAHCVRAVEAALRAQVGVKDAQVTIGEAIITTEETPNMAVLREAMVREGFELVG